MNIPAAVTMLAPLSKQAGTLASLSKVGAVLFGASAAKKLNIGEIIDALRGDAPPTPAMVKAARFVSGITGDKEKSDMVLEGLYAVLETQGVTREAFLKLLQTTSSFIKLPAPSNDEEVVDVIGKLSARIIEADDSHHVIGLVTCPKCRYVHLI